MTTTTHGNGDSDSALLSTHTRFAWPLTGSKEKEKDAMSASMAEPVELQSLRHILPTEKGTASSPQQKFYLSALDLEIGSYVSVDGKKMGRMKEMPLQLKVVAPTGSQLTVHSPNGKPLKTWEVPMGMRQLMVNKRILGSGDGHDTCDTLAR